MKFSEYVALRERERNATVQSLLIEIEELERQLMIISAALNKLKENKIIKDKHHTIGFIGGNDEKEFERK